MAGDASEYLAVNVLNEGNTVTYRTLSRALKVHSNVAKQMLYDFHSTQNSKKAGSLHATFLLTGRQRVRDQITEDRDDNDDDVDVDMRSSPFPSASATQHDQDGQQGASWIKLITLTREEHLDDAKANFDDLLSIHVYSLEPGPIKDLQTLSECNRKVAVEFATEDPLEMWKQYGTIQNANVKRRTARRPPPVVPATASAPKPSKPTAPPPVKQEKPDTPVPAPQAATSSRRTTAAAATKTAPPKRESSSLFKSFAKAKPPKPANETPAEPSSAQTPAADDELMTGLSDEDADDDDDDNNIDEAAMLDAGSIDRQPATTTTTTTIGGKTRKQREDELRRMMEEAEDEPMGDDANASATTPAEPSRNAEDEAKPEPERPETEPETEAVPAPAPAETPEIPETATSNPGRRRGKRRVMKKKTVKDEEGYLVTREEAAWESFSEDDEKPTALAPAAKKAKLTSAATPGAGKKGSGAATKTGQGSIMSFFKKA